MYKKNSRLILIALVTIAMLFVASCQASLLKGGSSATSIMPDFTLTSDGLNVTFTDNSAEKGTTIKTWVWEFGDGSKDNRTVTSLGASVSHTYSEIGTYTAKLTISNGKGLTRSKIRQFKLTEAGLAFVTSNFDIESTTDSKQFNFVDKSAVNGTSIKEWIWNFGDGSKDNTSVTSSGGAVLHKYTGAGTYTVSLTVKDDTGLIDESEQELVVAPEPGAPEVNASFNYVSAGGLGMTFSDNSTAKNATISSYEWDFNNDGSIDSTTPTNTFTYPDDGNYIVSLVVVDNKGNRYTSNKTVEIKTMKVFIGINSTYVLKPDGSLYNWGGGVRAPTQFTYFSSNGIDIKDMAVGDGYTLALGANGKVYSWGNNNNGQLCLGNTTSTTTPTEVTTYPAGSKITKIYANSNNGTFAITADGDLYVCGSNNLGQLGEGNTNNLYSINSPKKINFPAGTKISWVASKTGKHNLAGTSTGAVYGWGYNTFGQLGLNHTNTPSSPALISANIASVNIKYGSVGSNFTYLVSDANVVYAFGYDFNVNYANSPTTTVPNLVTHIPNSSQLKMITTGGDVAFYLLNDGTLYGLGTTRDGQLGTGNTSKVTNPIKNNLPAGTNVRYIFSGQEYSIAQAVDDTLYIWGKNDSSQIGNGGTGSVLSPIIINIP